ncbi:MAG: hypothetical protein K0V04_02450 [Deltaproteobacteria bacterium]|nr:hypothetical protein [Deltaproteobacteria bacterium]
MVKHRNTPHRACTLAIIGLTIAGCFGDWVSARTRANRDEPAAPSPPAPDPIADPCGAYLAEVSDHCTAMVEGRLLSARCHTEITRVMSLYGDESVGKAPAHGRRSAGPREPLCTRYLQGLSASATDRDAEPVPMGRECTRWANQVRTHCVAPLSTAPPQLSACTSDLLAFESVLGGITFGRAERYETQCADAMERWEPTENPL